MSHTNSNYSNLQRSGRNYDNRQYFQPCPYLVYLTVGPTHATQNTEMYDKLVSASMRFVVPNVVPCLTLESGYSFLIILVYSLLACIPMVI